MLLNLAHPVITQSVLHTEVKTHGSNIKSRFASRSRSSSVGIMTTYGLDNLLWMLERARVSLRSKTIQTGSGDHPAPYSTCTGVLSQGYCSWGMILTTQYCPVPSEEWVELYLYSHHVPSWPGWGRLWLFLDLSKVCTLWILAQTVFSLVQVYHYKLGGSRNLHCELHQETTAASVGLNW